MGICKQLHDERIDGFEFIYNLCVYHDRCKLSEQEIERLRFKELVVKGIPIETMCRATMFQNSV